MTHISYDPSGIPAHFKKNQANQLSIEFIDPTFTRAETILYDPNTQEIHALLHEGLFTIGHVPQGFQDSLGHGDEIILCADHYAGHKVTMRAALSILKN